MDNREISRRVHDLERRVASLEARQKTTRQYNFGCGHFTIIDGEAKCDKGCDTTYCTRSCFYATNPMSIHELKGGKIKNVPNKKQQ